MGPSGNLGTFTDLHTFFGHHSSSFPRSWVALARTAVDGSGTDRKGGKGGGRRGPPLQAVDPPPSMHGLPTHPDPSAAEPEPWQLAAPQELDPVGEGHPALAMYTTPLPEFPDLDAASPAVQAAVAATQAAARPNPADPIDPRDDPRLNRLADELTSLSIVEYHALARLICRRIGISESLVDNPGSFMPGPPGTAAAPSKAGPETAAEGASDDEADATPATPSKLTVRITAFDKNKKLPLIKEVRNLVEGLSLIAAKKLIDSAPSVLKEDVTPEEGERIKAVLEPLGAEIELA